MHFVSIVAQRAIFSDGRHYSRDEARRTLGNLLQLKPTERHEIRVLLIEFEKAVMAFAG